MWKNTGGFIIIKEARNSRELSGGSIVYMCYLLMLFPEVTSCNIHPLELTTEQNCLQKQLDLLSRAPSTDEVLLFHGSHTHHTDHTQ